MLIFLIGLPGSGKTTLGKQLAKKLDYTFSDLDEKIVQRYESSIEKIFAEQGEPTFRLYEKTCLQDYEPGSRLIVSTGGGAACFFDNMEWMNTHGLTVYLKPPLTELVKRLHAGKNAHRPLLKGLSMNELSVFLEERYKDRNPFYEKARLIIEKENPSVYDLLEKIKPLLS